MHRNQLCGIRQFGIVLAVAAAAVLLTADTAWAAKNVILMITDGGGCNTWLATSLYQGKLGKQVYDQPGWQLLGCSTYPLNLSTKPTGDETQDRELIYDSLKAWDATSVEYKKTKSFAGYVYLTTTPTDSAAAATAMATGRKTYNNAINWSNDNRPLRGLSIAEIAKARGKSTGVITTVQWSDATPAGLGGAHSVTRKNHVQIANEMLDGGWLDVIMGAGNPDFDNDGHALPADAKRNYEWVGGEETWKSLKRGKTGWRLIEGKADFAALASGPAPPKVVGTAQVANTLQEMRASHDRREDRHCRHARRCVHRPLQPERPFVDDDDQGGDPLPRPQSRRLLPNDRGGRSRLDQPHRPTGTDDRRADRFRQGHRGRRRLG